MIFIAKNAFVLQWMLADPNGLPINNANVTATLYVGRSLANPDNVPGVPVPPINVVPLIYVAASAGIYQGSIPATLDPAPTSQPYVLVVDASVASTPVYHTEQPSSVIPYPIDLTTLDAVKDELSIKTTEQDGTLEQYITAFSQSVLNETGIQSFSLPVQMNEVRDGNGNTQMFTRMRPIINVSAVTVSGVAIPAAGAWPSWGYYVSDDLRSIRIRQAGNPVGFNYYPSGGGQVRIPASPGFSRGVGNVQLSYYAGYNNVPPDLERAACRAVAVYYGRKQTRDLASKGLTSGGTNATTRYRDWAVPPEVSCVVEFYRRLAII